MPLDVQEYLVAPKYECCWCQDIQMTAIHAELLLHPTEKPLIKLYQGLDEELEGLDGHHIYKVLSKFKPSSLDHETIQRELHHHLFKHGYMSDSPRHPLVRSPEENKHAVEWSKVTQNRQARHVGWHSDQETEKNHSNVKSSLFGVWSTKHPTQIRDRYLKGSNTPRKGGTDKDAQGGAHKGASKAGHVVLIDDAKAQHKAGSSPDRWFSRIPNIRKIPKTGLELGGKKFGGDIERYIKAKQKHKYRQTPENTARAWLKNNKKHPNYKAAKEYVKKQFGLRRESFLLDDVFHLLFEKDTTHYK